MKISQFLIIFLLPLVLIAQKGYDVTGRVSLRVTNTYYDETSEINPDSANYGKTTLIPGLQQSLNLALFARTSKMDMTLLGDIRNNHWNELESLKSINRLSLSMRFGSNEIILGDFFESGSELFVQSREVRGAKVHLKFDNIWNRNSFLETKVTAGQIQKAYAKDERSKDIYKQYETAGIYRRYLASGMLKLGQRNLFEIGANYLYAKDDESSIDDSINEPLKNQNIGANGSLYLWSKRINLFGEGFVSRKDTISAKGVQDHAIKGGVDFRISQFKLLAFYQRIGYDYYSAGYPFLENDRQGFKLVSAYNYPRIITIFLEAEQYDDNLNNISYQPTTTTRYGEFGFTTQFKNLPELTLKWRLREDNSNTITDEDDNPNKTDKISSTYEGRLGYTYKVNRLSLSALFIDLDDNSLLAAGSPLGTEQFIASFNFYTRLFKSLYISAGSVYSRLLMTNSQDNKNLYIYESSRWDLIPRKLKFESTISYITNNASNGGYQDLLSDYNLLGAELSLEYFFTSNISLKIIGGTDLRHMRYSTAEALNVVADPDYGPMFFNGSETYNGITYGAEINWIF